MALSEKSRSALYQGLSNVAYEEAVQEMLSHFPARDVEEPVTQEFLRAELSDMELRLNEKINRSLVWSISAQIGTAIAMAAVLVAAIRV